MNDPYQPLLSLFTLAPRLRQASGRTLSLYLPVRSEGFDEHRYELELRHLVGRYEDRLAGAERAILESELPRLQAHLEIARPAGCPAACGFAEESTGVLELILLPGPVEARLEVGEPLLAPVLRQLEEFPPALIAVVDKEEARVFGVILEQITALDHVVGAPVSHSRPGGASAQSNQRKSDNRARANLGPVAQAVARHMDGGAYRWLYLAGPDEALAQFERLLPDRLHGRVGGHMSASLDAAELKRTLREHLKAAAAP